MNCKPQRPATLESITLKGNNANTGVNVTYGLGYSAGTQISGKNVDTTFSFTTLSGEVLTLNTADTYRFITVSSGVLNLFTDSTKTYVYNDGGTGAVAATTSGNTVTITQGLTAPGMRWDYNTGTSVDDCCAIFAANIGSGTGTYSPIVSSMTINLVPEPTTATLSLLALAGLAARRRRK